MFARFEAARSVGKIVFKIANHYFAFGNKVGLFGAEVKECHNLAAAFYTCKSVNFPIVGGHYFGVATSVNTVPKGGSLRF